MDYNIDYNALSQKMETIDSNSKKATTTVNEMKSSLTKFSNTEISTVIESVNKALDSVDKSYNNISSWGKRYVDGIKENEEKLVADTNSIDSFKGEFGNIFSKSTIPTLKTGGDKNANVITEENEKEHLLSSGNTQFADLSELGAKADANVPGAREEFFNKLNEIVGPICDKYGFPRSVVMAQMIQETGWLANNNWLTSQNNVLGVNYEMWGSSDYKVAKDGTVNENAPIPNWASYQTWATGQVSGGEHLESPRQDAMRTYNSIEDCVEDYIGLMVGYRPWISGKDYPEVIEEIKHYAEDVNYASDLTSIINENNLSRFDKKTV